MLRAWGWAARTSRSVQGVQGGADLITDCPLSIEVKDHARMELAAWVDQAVAQAQPATPGACSTIVVGRATRRTGMPRCGSPTCSSWFGVYSRDTTK